MELKFIIKVSNRFNIVSSNRTFMELKYLSGKEFSHRQVF